MTSTPVSDPSQALAGKRLAFVGRLASMPRREAAQLARQHGAVVVEKPDPAVHLIVVGEDGLPLPAPDEGDAWLDAATRQAAEAGAIEVIPETRLWQRLGLVDADQNVHRLYTPAMLAGLLHVPVAVIRRWRRRGLIRPVREVRKLPYFDFQEVATARRLAELLAAGASPQAIERKLEEVARFLPGVERPLAQLSVIVEGKDILLRQGDGLLEPGGQLRFDFEAVESADGPSVARPGPRAAQIAEIPAYEAPAPRPAWPQAVAGVSRPGGAPTTAPGEGPAADAPPSPSPAEMCRMAAELEEDGRLADAAEMLRAALAAAGPNPEVCFQVAELLYRLGDLGGARERYYVAVELDEDYVEARNNLGCVLAETGQKDLAVAAFQGALAYHPEYADAHYHLARLLDEQGRRDEAETHWRTFAGLAPDSPWAEEARARLSGAEV